MPLPFIEQPRETPFTFAEPGRDVGVAQTLTDIASTLGRGSAALNQAMTAPVLDPLLNPDRYRNIFDAAERSTRLTGNAFSQNAAEEEVLDRRIAAIVEATGVQLENPQRWGYQREARLRLRDMVRAGEDTGVGGIPAMRLKIFEEKAAELRAANPEQSVAFDTTLMDTPQQVGKRAHDEFERTMAQEEVNPVAGFAASLAGAMWGSRRDPLFTASLFVGPTAATGRYALSRVATSGLYQGLFNMGLTLAEQPVVQAWKRDAGLRHGVVPAAEETALAFLFGFIPGAAIRGFQEFANPVKASLTRIMSGQAQSGDAELVAKAAGLTLEPETSAALRAGEAALRADDAALGPVPSTVPRETADQQVAQALRHAENPDVEPPPEIVTPAPARPADQVRVIDEVLPANVGDREIVAGKPVTFERFDPNNLQTDATAFQYKGGADASGVTERLRHVTQWDPTASGKTFVFERSDGTRVIADGHQRLGLAKRLASDDPNATIRLDGFLFREADGWTVADVRALAAKKNMQEGSGDALDAARILRDRPDLIDGALPVTGPMMKNAMALARLSDEAFGMALNGVVPVNQAAAVGAMVPDRLQHAAVMADLARFQPDSEREARLLIGEIMSAGFKAEEQINLFGASSMVSSLMGERVKALDAALQALVRDKRLFGTLAEKAEAIEAAGNVLARGVNEQRAADAAALADMVTRLAQRTGPVSDALNRAAAQIADGVKPGKAAQGFLDELRLLLDRDGLNGLLATPELRPRGEPIEPGTVQAADAAQISFLERTEPAGTPPAAKSGEVQGDIAGTPEKTNARPDGELSLFEAVPVATRPDGADTRFITIDQALADAEKTADHAALVKSCKD